MGQSRVARSVAAGIEWLRDAPHRLRGRTHLHAATRPVRARRRLRVSDDTRDQFPLEIGSIAALQTQLIEMLDRHRLPSTFNGTPNEIEGALPFRQDHAPRNYSRDSANRLRQSFAVILPVFERFRAGFTGKSSPVHLWWGSFDLAVSRFSGRKAPPHPGGTPGLPDRITREAYSDEVSSGGFWAAGAALSEPFFYSYIYPEPSGYRAVKIPHGRFDETYGEFVLSYAQVRASNHPERMLGEFLQSTYEAAADLAHWNRTRWEREPVAP